ncbi:MAG: 30S ribosomal protein S11 [Candidatus Andersenbacteria bacterium]
MAKATKTTTKKKSKGRRKVKQGIITIQSTYNNTLVTIADAAGNVLASSSAGRVGFSGARKATPYAAGRAVADVMERLKPFGMEEAEIVVRGIGSARESAVRAFSSSGLMITSIRDITPIPHNGVRPPKRRRV